MKFKTEALRGEWDRVDPRLQIALWALDGYLGGTVRITSLVHHGEAGRVSNSKHQINPRTGKCEAADVNPDYGVINANLWRMQAKQFLDAHFQGLDTLIHAVAGGAEHLHIEIDLHPPQHRMELI